MSTFENCMEKMSDVNPLYSDRAAIFIGHTRSLKNRTTTKKMCNQASHHSECAAPHLAAKAVTLAEQILPEGKIHLKNCP